jgi:hypothetical protein
MVWLFGGEFFGNPLELLTQVELTEPLVEATWMRLRNACDAEKIASRWSIPASHPSHERLFGFGDGDILGVHSAANLARGGVHDAYDGPTTAYRP